LADKLFVANLVYGYAGAGKTYYCTTALVDNPSSREAKRIRRGKWVTFGRESNPALHGLGEDHIALVSPLMDTTQFADDFVRLGEQVYKENMRAIKAGNPVPVEALVVDGFSEFDLLYEQIVRKGAGGNKFLPWNELLTKVLGMLQLLDPQTLRCHILATARVTEKRRAMKDKSGDIIVPEDAEYISAYHPSMRGQMRDALPHYFNLVFYLDRVTKLVTVDKVTDKASLHRINLVPDEEFLVKNNWETQWIKEKKPRELLNPTFDQVLGIINELTGDKA